METLDSELFTEWLGLAGTPSPAKDDPLGPDDALCVIDMQADFLPQDAQRNPHGGRFGVAEGLDIIETIVKLIDMAADSGATVVATRDYRAPMPPPPRPPLLPAPPSPRRAHPPPRAQTRSTTCASPPRAVRSRRTA